MKCNVCSRVRPFFDSSGNPDRSGLASGHVDLGELLQGDLDEGEEKREEGAVDAVLVYGVAGEAGLVELLSNIQVMKSFTCVIATSLVLHNSAVL